MSQFIRLTSLEIEIMQLLIPKGEVYGLNIMNLINERRRKHQLPEISHGSFYPALKKLAREGLLEAEWGSDTTSRGARRKYYKVNGLGIRTYETNLNLINKLDKDNGRLEPEGA